MSLVVRYMHCSKGFAAPPNLAGKKVKLLSADEAAAAYSQLLGSEEAGELFATGDELGRLKAVARLLPRDR